MFDDLEIEDIKLVKAGFWAVKDMFNYSKDQEFNKYMEMEAHNSIESTKNYLKKWLDGIDKKEKFFQQM